MVPPDNEELLALMRAQGVAQPRWKRGAPEPPSSPKQAPPPKRPAPAPPAPPKIVTPSPAELLARARVEIDQLKGRVIDLERERSELLADRDRTEQARRKLQSELSQRPALSLDAPSPPSLRDLLGEAGFATERDLRLLMRALGRAGRLPDLLRIAQVREPSELLIFLEDRVCRVCTACAPLVPAARGVIEVEPDQCDTCEGSPLARAMPPLEAACEVAGVGHLLVVGGSPNYRIQLRKLFAGTPLKLSDVDGVARRTQNQAKGDMKRAQVVILWGGTFLDHSVSQLYRGGPARVLSIPHRGISGMLSLLTAALSREN